MELGALPGGEIAAAELFVRTIEINGQSSCVPESEPDGLFQQPPGMLSLPDRAGSAVSATLDMRLDAFVAQAGGAMLIDPDRLEDNRLTLRATGIGAPDEVVVELAFDAEAFLPVLEPGANPAGTDLRLDPDRPGWAEVRAGHVDDLASGLVVLAQLALLRAVAKPGERNRQIGRLGIRAVSVDGVDLLLAQGTATGAETDAQTGLDRLARSDEAMTSGLAIPFAAARTGGQSRAELLAGD
jgi:hypothetical protein